MGSCLLEGWLDDGRGGMNVLDCECVEHRWQVDDMDDYDVEMDV